MSGTILKTFQKNYEKLTQEYVQYKEFHDTMTIVIPNILELLDSLFLEEHVKAAPNYDLLVVDYLDAIKTLIAPENYQQIKLETQLPDIYDAPSTRRGKVKQINKMLKPKITPTIQPTSSATPSTTSDVRGSGGTSSVNPIVDPYAVYGRRKAPVRVLPIKVDPLPIKVEGGGLDLEAHLRKQEERQISELSTVLARLDPKGLKGTENQYRSPLDALRESDDPSNPSSQGKLAGLSDAPPVNLVDRIYISLPDGEDTQALLMDDGRIMDLRNGQERGRILPTGKVLLDKKEFGCIPLVERTDTQNYIPVSHCFGRFKETSLYQKAS